MTAARRQQIDLRLVPAALLSWLAALWGLGRSPRVVLGCALLAAAVTAVATLRGRSNPRWYTTAAACCAVVVVLLPLAARMHRAHESTLSQLARSGAEVSVELRVTGDPRSLASKGTSGAPRSAVDASALELVSLARPVAVSGQVLVLGPAEPWRPVLPGQRVRVAGRLSRPLAPGLLVAVLSEQTPPELLGRPPVWQRAAGSIRAGMRRAAAGLPPLPRGLLPGLVDGDTSQLDPVLANRFQTAGLTHLVAVSGTNVSILIAAVGLVLRRFRAAPLVIALVGAAVLAGFILIARPSPSVLRAAVMAGIALLGLATGRQRAAVPSLAATTLVLLVYSPSLAGDLGFALSVAATAALLLIAPGWVRALTARGVPGGLAEPVAVAAAAHLVTVPLIVGLSGHISLVAIPANLLAEPVVAVVTVLGVLAAVLSVLWLPAAILLAQVAGWPCRWLVWVAEYFGSLAGASLPWPSGLIGGLSLAAVIGALWLVCRYRPARAVVAVGLLVGLMVQIPVRAVVSGWPPRQWLMVACDVGQGDALALNAGPATAVVIDAGPDPVAVDRCLREIGITRVPLLVLTHSHLDHVGGLVGVFHQRQVARVVTSPFSEPASGHRLILTVLAQHHIALQQVSAGAHLSTGPIQLDVLGPVRSYHNTRSDPNNSSVVLRATVAGERILLPGDIEVEAQDDVLASGADLRADILKVPHHGSAYSDPAFLQAVHARLAVITVGLNNDYGHPSPLLLAELARLGVPVRRTDLDGDIAVTVQRGRILPVLHATAVTAGRARAPPVDFAVRCCVTPA